MNHNQCNHARGDMMILKSSSAINYNITLHSKEQNRTFIKTLTQVCMALQFCYFKKYAYD